MSKTEFYADYGGGGQAWGRMICAEGNGWCRRPDRPRAYGAGACGTVRVDTAAAVEAEDVVVGGGAPRDRCRDRSGRRVSRLGAQAALTSTSRRCR
jgi:hypothetical protein